MKEEKARTIVETLNDLIDAKIDYAMSVNEAGMLQDSIQKRLAEDLLVKLLTSE